jgi:hypothetical protein
MKSKLAGILLLIGMGVAPALASDRRDIRHDEARIAHDRHQLHKDLRRGNYAAARHERRKLHRDYRELHHDRY